MNVKSVRAGVWLLSLGFSLAVLAADDNRTPESATFKAGKVFVPQGGKNIEAIKDLSFPGDILIKTNGAFKVSNGKLRQMREGQTIDAQGMLSSPDGSVVPVFDHITLKSGRVQIVRDGDSKPLTGELALPNGMKVLADGSLRGPGGSLRRLLDGQLLKLDGTAVGVTDTISLKDGKVVLFKDGGRLEVRRGQVIAMSDGTRVSGDGSIVRPDGSKETLKDGDTIKIPGVISARR